MRRHPVPNPIGTFLSTRARKLRISSHDLRAACERYEEIKRNQAERHYCESCGRKVYDGNLEESELIETRSDEEGLTYCMDCANELESEDAT